MRRKTKLAVIATLVGLLAAGAAAMVWWSIGRPLYEPGMVRAGRSLRGPLEPPAQIGDGYWLVEPDIRLAYHAHGEGRPILMVHGGPGVLFGRPPAGLGPLTRDFTLYSYDRRGCGGSTRPFDRFESSNYYRNMTTLERTLGIGAQVADIERIRRLLGQERLILLGHSFGGLLAAMYAAEFPERIEALVLVAPSAALVLPGEGAGFFGEIRNRLPAEERPEYDRFLEDYLDFGAVFTRSESDLARRNRRLGDYFLKAVGELPADRSAADPAPNGGWMVQAVYFSMGMRHDYRARLRHVRAPVLVVHGEDDLKPERAGQMYVDSFPNAQLHILRKADMKEGRAGHFLLDDRSGAFAQVVGRFLAEHLDLAHESQ